MPKAKGAVGRTVAAGETHVVLSLELTAAVQKVGGQ